MHHGFAIKTCRPYRPQTKGKIERLIGYFRKNCHLPRVFDSLADANAAMAAWCLEANARVHGTTPATAAPLPDDLSFSSFSSPSVPPVMGR